MWIDVKHIEEIQEFVIPNGNFGYTGGDGNSNVPHMYKSYCYNSVVILYIFRMITWPFLWVKNKYTEK